MDCLWISEILMDPKYDVYSQGNVEFCCCCAWKNCIKIDIRSYTNGKDAGWNGYK